MSLTNRNTLNILKRDGILKTGRALDLGCGVGIDAENLAGQGFIVEAVDKSSEAIQCVPKSPSILPFVSDIENYGIAEDTYQLISCQFTFNYLTKPAAKEVIRKMVAGTVVGGIILFNLIGEKDEYKDKWTIWTKKEADAFLSRLPVRVYKTIVEEGMGIMRDKSMKRWHILNYVLVKK